MNSGYHTETLAPQQQLCDRWQRRAWPLRLLRTRSFPMCIAVADPDGDLPWNVTPDDTDAHFHIYVIAAAVQGFGSDQAWVDSPQGWAYGPKPQAILPSFTAALAAEGFASGGNVVLPGSLGHWNSATTDLAETPQGPVPQSVAAGDNVYLGIAAQAKRMQLTYPLQPNDVIDVQLIGHSRGSAVIDRAFQDLVDTANLPQEPLHSSTVIIR